MRTTVDAAGPDGRLEMEPAATRLRLVRRGKGLSAVPEQELPELTAEAVRAALESVRR